MGGILSLLDSNSIKTYQKKSSSGKKTHSLWHQNYSKKAQGKRDNRQRDSFLYGKRLVISTILASQVIASRHQEGV
jgi:hypothetical protein